MAQKGLMSSTLLERKPVLLDGDSTLRILVNLYTSLKAQSPNIVTLTPTCGFGGDTIQSIAGAQVIITESKIGPRNSGSGYIFKTLGFEVEKF